MKNTMIFLFFYCPSIVLACSCIGKSMINSEIKKTDVLFLGKVLSKKIFSMKIEYLPEEFYPKKIEYKVLVTKKYKGNIITDTLKIVTGIGSGDCGFNFLIDHSYIIYGMYSEKRLESREKVNEFIETDICTRTRLYECLEEKKIVRYLRRHPSR
ncbi:hypothetical protein [Flavobacterium lipolyticum]|uniref:Tissue inhibitor of metalloproteinase n=1 Tax=Flavobacterium lipolyticum TaxID=2893754 RepID=A0ABS8M536_9FLAO|nr:hypothetical protein [Flavobacterium sp. F-126]MCC9019919.1 hypothetical protein [Flavobacterium sp. F-126]